MIEWTISDEQRLVRATVIGRVTQVHFEAYLAAISAAGAAPYRKLFHIADASAIAPQDIPAFAALVVEYGRGAGKVGPLAIVVAGRETNQLANWFKSLASLERPVRIFDRESTAMAWLDGIAPPRSA